MSEAPSREKDWRYDSGAFQPLPVEAGRAVVLRAEGLTKIYAAVSESGRGGLELFRGLDLTVYAGDMVDRKSVV